ncbi:hypothetical protein Vretimale_8485 [Volvox reticuliferus]|uniref:F-box domain-containing protein n=1 Tax=Volvox reticuliferus TaxID=1737510 RepID=A0A8J4GBH5_9CHLO|nr:hypothetical protein Vretifemale_11649 [Volvox reticuliferus]GIM03796.1 hypothetical protein Vretimale_8485 [Volvox reticuliferus]
MMDMSNASPLFLLPSMTFCRHIYTCLSKQERKAFRLVCKDYRFLVNGEVNIACVPGSLLGDLTLQRIVKSCPQLNCLTLMDSPNEHVCGDLLVEFLNGHVDEEGFQAIPGARIQKLDVKDCNYIKATDMQHLIAVCPRLHSLRTSRLADGSHLSAFLPISDQLTELDLGDNSHNILSITDKSLAHLPRMPALRSLSLKRCIDITDGGLAHLSATRLPNLTSLDLSFTRVAGISGFKTMSTIRSLVVVGCRGFGDMGLEAVCACHASTLRALYLHGTAVKPDGTSLRHLVQAGDLEVLDLGTAWEVDSDGLAALSRCRSLADLRLGNFNLRRQQLHQNHHQPLSGLAVAAGITAATAHDAPCSFLPNISRLSLGGMFGQHGLEQLSGSLPGLKRLELTGLDAARDQVLLQLVASKIGAAAALQELHLARGGPDLTSKGLMHLAALPALRHLTLVDCPCAVAGGTVQQLVNAVRRAGRELHVEVVAKPGLAPGFEGLKRFCEGLLPAVTAPHCAAVAC